MEGPQRGCVETCQGVPHLPTEKSRAYPSSSSPTTTTHSGVEMGEHINELNHGATTGTGERLHLCSGRLTDQVRTLFRHPYKILSTTGS